MRARRVVLESVSIPSGLIPRRVTRPTERDLAIRRR